MKHLNSKTKTLISISVDICLMIAGILSFIMVEKQQGGNIPRIILAIAVIYLVAEYVVIMARNRREQEHFLDEAYSVLQHGGSLYLNGEEITNKETQKSLIYKANRGSVDYKQNRVDIEMF